MITEPELLNERLERLAIVLDEIMPNCALLFRDTIELLKKQEETEEEEYTERINVFFTFEQLKQIKTEAEKVGLTVSAYVRMVTMKEVNKYG